MNSFATDVLNGLSAKPKFISPKYFYDKEGSRIFSKITTLREYYPTRTEYQILSDNKDEILRYILHYHKLFQLVELGAGDAKKTRILISYFINKSCDFTYVPIDICEEENLQLSKELKTVYEGLVVHAITSDFLETLQLLKQTSDKGKVIMFLGSTIGNMTHEETVDFLKSIHATMNSDDLLLTGFDLRKHPKMIAEAYNDSSGFTRDLNLNLLKRINRELDADFNLSCFEHFPLYDPEKGEARSYLISNIKQKVTIGKINKQFDFEEGEVIFTEVSRKFTLPEIDQLANDIGFEVLKNYCDEKGYFADALWRKG